MKRSLLILALLFTSFTSFSQTTGFEILKTTNADLKKDDVFVAFLTLKDSTTLLINTNDDQLFTFQKYDKDLNLLKISSTTVYSPAAKARNYRGVIQLKDKYFLSFSKIDRNDYLYSFYVLEFDPYTMQFVGTINRIVDKEQMARGTINKIPNMHFGYRNIPNTINCYYKNIQIETPSPDSSKYLFAYSIADSASHRGNKMLKYAELEIVSDSEKVHFDVFDANFKKLWKREVVFKNKIKIEDYAITNDGKLFVLAKIDSMKSSFVTNYEIYIFKDSISKPDTTCPNFVAKSMLDGKFYSPDRINFKIFGTFYNKYFGFYSVTIYDTMPHYGETSGDITQVSKKNDVFLREIIKTENGKFKVIFEEYGLNKFIDNKEYEARTEKSLIKEEFGDLFVMSVNNKGNIEWVTTIPKLQVDIKNASSVYTFLTYKSSEDENNIRFYYIDNTKNFGTDESTWKTDYELGRHACLAGVTINPSGNIRKYNIGKIDNLGSLKTEFIFSKNLMYTVNHLNKENKIYKLKMD